MFSTIQSGALVLALCVLGPANLKVSDQSRPSTIVHGKCALCRQFHHSYNIIYTEKKEAAPCRPRPLFITWLAVLGIPRMGRPPLQYPCRFHDQPKPAVCSDNAVCGGV